MTLTEKRILFTTLLGRLLVWASDLGLLVAVDEVKRGKQQAQWNAQHGLGIADSVHLVGLAADLLGYRKQDGALLYISDGSDPIYAALGKRWKTLHALARWGGDFTRPDPGHVSLEHEGRQ